LGEPVVLAFDFGGSKIGIAIADLEGDRLADAKVTTQPERGAGWNFAQAVTCARQLLAASAIELDLVAIGACTFGVPTDHGVLLAPAIPGWERLALREELINAFQCRAVSLRTDVKAAAEAEARSGALVGADPAIYLNLGTGLAVGIVCGGQVVNGANGAAGEIGYNLRQVNDLDLVDMTRLEDVVSGMALAAAAGRVTGASLTAAQVFEAEPDNDGLAAAVDDFVRELSFHIVNLCTALNPTRVAVGGGIIRSWARIEPQLRRALNAFVPFPPELVPGAYPYDAALVGAITLGLQEASALEHSNQIQDRHVRHID
jgi:glucokinase